MKTTLKSSEISVNIYCCMYEGCHSEYSTKFNLKRHVESVHMYIKKYCCSICKSKFCSKQGLKEHLRIHSGVMPYKCTTCEKSFRQASQLSLHRRVHIMEGKDAEFLKMKLDEEFFDFKPIKVSLKVDERKYRLPEISCERRAEICLAFPVFP